MHQLLRCASDSYKFELISDVESDGNQISGRWSERTHSLAGNLSGRVRGRRLDVLVKGDVFNAEVTMISQGNRQTVTISSPGSQLSGVAISLRRS